MLQCSTHPWLGNTTWVVPNPCVSEVCIAKTTTPASFMSTPRTNRRLKSISWSPSARCRVQSKREGWEAKVLAWTVRTKAEERTCWKKQEMTNLSQVHIKQPGYITYKSHQAETIPLTNPQLHQTLKARGEYIGGWPRSSVIARDSFLNVFRTILIYCVLSKERTHTHLYTSFYSSLHPSLILI